MKTSSNPLLAPSDLPFGMPPFAAITVEDFSPAFDAALAASRCAIDAIAADPDPADFANTIEALERVDRDLDRVSAVFFNLAATDATDALEVIQREMSPKLARHSSETMLNAALFARVEAVHAQGAAALGLDPEQTRLLILYHRMFVRAGARLQGSDRARLSEVMAELASLGTSFAQNIRADERDWSMLLGADDLAGLPQDLVAALAETARDRGAQGHVLTLSRSVIVPFLSSSPRRDLRARAFEAWIRRGETGGATDNLAIVARTLDLRAERARLLGYPHYAAFKLEPEMAGSPDAVRDLLMAVWIPARRQAAADEEKLAELMRADGINGPLEPWDWRYYAAMRQRREHDLDEAEIKPYLTLDAMIAASFDVASRLFGLDFVPIAVPLHHPDARAWEVRRNGEHVGVFVGDYFARSSKRSGAWCSRFRSQSRLDGAVSAIALNVCNFAKAPAGQPHLLTFDDARTLFHEFGHALHVLLSDVTYEFLSGTSVARDFVELPSQLYEHWLEVPEVLARHAREAGTGAAMPDDLRDRLLAARNSDQGFATVEYLASALVDLDLHAGPAPADPMAAQAATLRRLDMPRAIVMRHATPHFQHVFAGEGYASGYYSYMWSEVMDADAFAAFREAGDPFAREIASRLETHIYAAGNTRDAAACYQAFRGRLPGVAALLDQRGLDAA